jgi:hypothetical protein
MRPHHGIETTRNSRTQIAQGNRNPFIDNPYLATVIWGGPSAQNRWPNIFLSTSTFNLENAITIYPNPTTSNFTIDLNEYNNVIIYNSFGQIIYDEKPLQLKSEISLSNFSNGIYFIKVGSVTQKIIKE